MKCRYSENDVALYVEGDLGVPKEREFEAHLTACDACRELVGELRESQSVFKNLKQETVSSAALAHVRSRVLAELGSGQLKPGWGRWVYALAGMAFIVVAGVGLTLYLRNTGVQQAVRMDPLPPAAAVPLREGDSNSATVSAPEAAVEIGHPNRHRNAAVTVPLAKGGGRQRRQGVAHDEVSTPIEPPKQIVVKLLTDDPNIVIYWLVDQKNGGTL